MNILKTFVNENILHDSHYYTQDGHYRYGDRRKHVSGKGAQGTIRFKGSILHEHENCVEFKTFSVDFCVWNSIEI